ncbi:hypothetical protein DSL72_005596 [Monilinia vaccinii-corymbosi]|uniref:Uncharacterized protein n=1 Tax=Monilinia vaccinii-corymbosi TaxID=61207 RepID=A0A8A3PG67_9HELO|nr:hypothetical protein DSL72_005596 [Monilinia vaccinii-corymbosi]
MSLLKHHPLSSLKAKLSAARDHMKRDEAQSKSTTTSSSTPRHSNEKTPRQALAEAYMVMAMR